jgi:hypothetical protein
MNEGTGMRDGADASDAAGLGAQDAAVIMWEARERARHELTVNRPAMRRHRCWWRGWSSSPAPPPG